MTYDVNGTPFTTLSAAVHCAQGWERDLKARGYQCTQVNSTWDAQRRPLGAHQRYSESGDT